MSSSKYIIVYLFALVVVPAYTTDTDLDLEDEDEQKASYYDNYNQDYVNEQVKYNFGYGVHDPDSGDEKEHYEQRDGDTVKGSYSLKEADGSIRIVEYTADSKNGFQAVVRNIRKPKSAEVDDALQSSGEKLDAQIEQHKVYELDV